MSDRSTTEVPTSTMFASGKRVRISRTSVFPTNPVAPVTITFFMATSGLAHATRAEDLHLGHRRDESTAGLEIGLVLLQQEIEEVPRQHEVIIGLLLARILVDDRDVRAGRDTADLELVDLGHRLDEVGADIGIVEYGRTLDRRAQAVDRLAFRLELFEQRPQFGHVVAYARGEVLIGLELEQAGGLFRRDRRGNRGALRDRVLFAVDVENEAAAMERREFDIADREAMRGEQPLTRADRVDAAVLVV